jgi:hypothetical protein
MLTLPRPRMFLSPITMPQKPDPESSCYEGRAALAIQTIDSDALLSQQCVAAMAYVPLSTATLHHSRNHTLTSLFTRDCYHVASAGTASS